MATRFDIAFPYRVDGRGQSGSADEDAHLRQLIEQVLFTAPGERVNRPDFGSGLLRLVFEPNSDVLAATTQFTVHGSLQRWLGDRAEFKDVDVRNEDSKLTITVVYRRLGSSETQTATFVEEG